MPISLNKLALPPEDWQRQTPLSLLGMVNALNELILTNNKSIEDIENALNILKLIKEKEKE